jgi:transmembrane sensor
MEKEKLHRFFAGTTSIQEGMDIRAWMEASEEQAHFLQRA